MPLKLKSTLLLKFIANIKSLFLWTIGLIWFGFSFVILICSMFITSKERTYSLARVLFGILIRLMGIKLIVSGLENIEPNKSYLIMGNHESLFDLFVIPTAIPICFVGVEAAYHFTLPVWGYLVSKWECIPIERNDLKSAMESLEKAKNTLHSGMNIGILPEGHRTRTGKMSPFKKGPFHLAKNAKADILPFGINGLYDFNRKGEFTLHPKVVKVTIGKPLLYESYKAQSIDELRQNTFDTIYKLSRQ
jgi:1-acyl-sn-glycerol-3-phosphate acyltransferase